MKIRILIAIIVAVQIISLVQVAKVQGITNAIPASPDPYRPYARHAKIRVIGSYTSTLKYSYLGSLDEAYTTFFILQVGSNKAEKKVTQSGSGILKVAVFLKDVGGKVIDKSVLRSLKPHVLIELYYSALLSPEESALAYVKSTGTIADSGYLYTKICYSTTVKLTIEHLPQTANAYIGSEKITVSKSWWFGSGEREASKRVGCVSENDVFKVSHTITFYAGNLIRVGSSSGSASFSLVDPKVEDYTRTVKLEVRDVDTGKIILAGHVVVKLINAIDSDADGHPDATASVDGSGYANYVWRGTYEAKAEPSIVVKHIRYVFYSWEGRNGISITGNSKSALTYVTIKDDGTLIAWYKKEPPLYVVRVASSDGTSTLFEYYVYTDGVKGQEYTVYDIKRIYPFTVKLTRLDGGTGWEVRWYKDENDFKNDKPSRATIQQSREVTASVDPTYPYAKAIILKGTPPPPPPSKEYKLRVLTSSGYPLPVSYSTSPSIGSGTKNTPFDITSNTPFTATLRISFTTTWTIKYYTDKN